MPEPGEPRDRLAATLRAAGCVFAEEEADLLLADGRDLAPLVARRIAGEPLEQVLGWAAFAGLRVRVTPGVFVPRRRTEGLVGLALDLLGPAAAPVVVDLCCGTGAIAAVLTEASPAAEVHAADLDPAAVACARLNLDPARVHEGDLWSALPAGLRGRVDLVACNAPYVPSGEIVLMPPEARDHEHRVALDGGDDGLALHRRVAADARGWLAPGGWLLVETSTRQAERTARACTDGGLEAQVWTDDDLGATVVRARRTPGWVGTGRDRRHPGSIGRPRGPSGTMAR